VSTPQTDQGAKADTNAGCGGRDNAQDPFWPWWQSSKALAAKGNNHSPRRGWCLGQAPLWRIPGFGGLASGNLSDGAKLVLARRPSLASAVFRRPPNRIHLHQIIPIHQTKLQPPAHTDQATAINYPKTPIAPDRIGIYLMFDIWYYCYSSFPCQEKSNSQREGSVPRGSHDSFLI